MTLSYYMSGHSLKLWRHWDTQTAKFILSQTFFRITRRVTASYCNLLYICILTLHLSCQDAIIPCVGVAVTVLPGLVREAQDEVDMSTGSEDLPGVTTGRMAADRIRDILEELVEDGRM